MQYIKKILLLGKEGQLGFSLQRALNGIGQLYAYSRAQCDLSNHNQLKAIVQHLSPDVIINAAAYTAVDQAQIEPQLAYQVNAVAPAILAELAQKQEAHFIHYSTDYIFNGKKIHPYQEEDTADPINEYGASKLAGEKAIRSIGGHYWILRSSWVFSHYGHNFLKKIIHLANHCTELRVIYDQQGVPTSADFLADITSHMLLQSWITHNDQSDIYHIVPTGKTSWHGFAKSIIAYMHSLAMATQLSIENIIAVRTKDYFSPARRPLNACLSNQKIQNHFVLHLANWEFYVQHTLMQLLRK